MTQIRLRNEAENLKIECEYEEIKTIETGLNNLQTSYGGVDARMDVQPGSRLSGVGVCCLSDVLNKQNDLSLLLLQNQALALLHNTEPESFDGEDITKFSSFILSFERTIETRCTNDTDQFYYLQKYTKARPRELISSCNGIDSTKAFAQARRILLKNCGDEFRIAHKYLEKLQTWP